jgi:hypothetical protein
MSSTEQQDSFFADHEHHDPVARPQPNYTGLNACVANSNTQPVDFESRLADLTEEHDDLDQAIASMLCTPGCSDGVINRLKKRKLLIKDQIFTLKFACTAR